MTVKDPGDEARGSGGPNRSAARSAAIFGLAGALIGGVASFGGSYWTAHQVQSSAQVSAERSAYVSFTARTYQYMDNLVQLERGANPALYATLRTNLNNQIGPLFSALALVQYVGSNTAGSASLRVGGALSSIYIPVDESALDHAKLAAAIKEAQKFLSNFEHDTVNQLDG
jgi:hypothetical protein